jgi:tetratricopeptide (TPR) repeat protein
MDMSPEFQRALVLQRQGRHDRAEQELRKHLAAASDDPIAHAALAVSLLEQGKRDEAEREAREAVGRAPDLPLGHYVLARVLADRNRDDEAAAAIAEAVRLDPTAADAHALRGVIDFARGRWADALAAAEAALACDPENSGATNLRGMALVKLGRTAEAGAAIEAALARDPDDATTHANRGWTLLEQGRRREAMEHFRESLRLDPEGDWARAGMVEALKAGNPVYGVMLRYFLWMQKLPPRAQWGILVGGFLGSRFLGGVARANPAVAPWVMPILVAYGCFAVLTWLSSPLFNLLLFLHPFGRHALTADQRRQAALVGLCVGLALAFLAGGIVTGGIESWILPVLVCGLLAMPVAAVFECRAGWPRRAMAVVAGGLAAVGVVACAGWAGAMYLQPAAAGRQVAVMRSALGLFVPGIVISQFVANWLAGQRPTR